MLTFQDISRIHNISVETLRYRRDTLGIKSETRKHGSKGKLYTTEQILEILNFGVKEFSFGKVIHHTITYHIYESKMNYL